MWLLVLTGSVSDSTFFCLNKIKLTPTLNRMMHQNPYMLHYPITYKNKASTPNSKQKSAGSSEVSKRSLVSCNANINDSESTYLVEKYSLENPQVVTGESKITSVSTI